MVCTAALLAAYAPTLRILFNLWSTDEDLGHCFAVPAVMAWIIWSERLRWSKVPIQPTWWGAPVLLLGAGLETLSLMGVGPFTGSVAFLVSAAGIVLSLGGFRLVRAWAFPLLLSLFMLPKLVFVYNYVTQPLQLMATRLAAAMLSLLGLAVQRQGNLLNVAGREIAVIEACNGMRYLLSLAFVAVVLAYVVDPRPGMRWFMLAAAAPVAILGNALRVAAAGYSPALALGTPHLLAGWVIFVVCLAILAVTCRIAGRAHA